MPDCVSSLKMTQTARFFEIRQPVLLALSICQNYWKMPKQYTAGFGNRTQLLRDIETCLEKQSSEFDLINRQYVCKSRDFNSKRLEVITRKFMCRQCATLLASTPCRSLFGTSTNPCHLITDTSINIPALHCYSNKCVEIIPQRRWKMIHGLNK